jgi:hypothetical protein
VSLSVGVYTSSTSSKKRKVVKHIPWRALVIFFFIHAGQKHTYVNGRARLAEQQSAVVYVLGVRNEDDPQIILVGTSQRVRTPRI